MKHRNVYTVHYKPYDYQIEKSICVIAESKGDAYDKAVYEAIPAVEGGCPYSAWVTSVTYQNGNVRYFNTSEGNAY